VCNGYNRQRMSELDDLKLLFGEARDEQFL
jgi:hypothetical protein